MNIFMAIHEIDKDVIQLPVQNNLEYLNNMGYGIYKTVNRFHCKRTKKDVKHLDYFYIDIDGGDKTKQMSVIEKCPTPTKIIESKNGYHVYWRINQDMVKIYGHEKAVEYYEFIESLIINCTGADQSARDVARILRVPGFKHLKDPSSPFIVKEIFSSNTKVKPEHMITWFKSGYKQKPVVAVEEFAKTKTNFSFLGETQEDIFEKVTNIGAVNCLLKISGHSSVNSEKYSFENMASGKKFVLVNGKRISGAWIDKEGQIGSHSKASPTIIQWLQYFGHNKSDIAQILKEVFND